MTIKLQAFMAHNGVASRRASERLIEKKKVLVNNQVAHLGQRIDPNQDKVKVNGQILNQAEKLRYFLVNKPVGYISTTSDELGRKTVLMLLPQIKERVYPVGRLDLESEGLLLITNDGELAQKLTHPKYRVAKTYHVTVKGTPSNKAVNHLRHGVKLKDGFTKKATVTVLLKEEEQTTLAVTIYEGRNRQIRRMLERVGYQTLKLVRTKMGPFDLEMLDDKTVVELTAEQVSAVKNK